MRKVILSAAFVSLASVVAAAGSAFAADAAAPAVFQNAGCWSCHGYQGQGGRAGPRIAHIRFDYATFSNFVRTSSGNMPPFTQRLLPDEGLRQIYDYLQSVPEGPDPATTPLLQNVYGD